MIKLLRLACCIISMMVVDFSSFAQVETDLRDYEDFFKDKGANISEWLDHSNLGKYIRYRDIDLMEDQVNFSFRSLGWEILNDSVKANTGISLEELLMDKLQFIFNLEPQQVLMNVNQGKYTLFFEYREIDDQLILSVESRKNMGTISADLDISIENISLAGRNTLSSDQTIEELKKILFQTLDEYFKDKEVSFLKQGKYDMKAYFRIKNRLKLKVRNVQDIVERGYYEAINIDFLFMENNGKVNINYTLNCKYGSGIFLSPFEEDYKESDEKKVESFNDDLQEMIVTALKN